MGDCDSNKKIHMLSWDMVCRLKDKGGLGVKASSQMNQAMLAKLDQLENVSET